MARAEEDMLALRHRQEKSKSLADLVVSALLAAANIYEVEERVRQTKSASESRQLVRVVNDATGVELLP